MKLNTIKPQRNVITNYTYDGFSSNNQKELAEIFRQLDEMKCKVMLTNSNTPLVRELYAPFVITEVGSKRAINCKAAKREGHSDLIIRNYSSMVVLGDVGIVM